MNKTAGLPTVDKIALAEAATGGSSSSATRLFTSFAKWTAEKSGSASTFALALFVIVVWAVTGPIFHYNDTWQLVINTGTTIVTFLMVFLIQNTQNRDTSALQVKLDELIRVQQGAQKVLLDLEELDQASLESIRKRYEQLAEQERNDLDRGLSTDAARTDATERTPGEQRSSLQG